MNIDAKKIVTQLNLKPHPEGGFYKRNYESEEMIHTAHGTRHAMSSIYYLLAEADHSKWHRLTSFERWFHHSGEAVLIHKIMDDGTLTTETLGSIEEGMPVVDIPKNTWFSAELSQKKAFALVSCTVCPGFNFDDFELANSEHLIDVFQQHREIIQRLS